MTKKLIREVIKEYNKDEFGIMELANEYGDYELYLYVSEDRSDKDEYMSALNESIYPFGNREYKLKPMSIKQLVDELESFKNSIYKFKRMKKIKEGNNND